MKRILFHIIFFICIGTSSFSQSNKNIDSLLNLLSKSPHDTLKVKYYYKLCWEYMLFDPKTAKEYGFKSLNLARKIGFKKGEAGSLNNIGNLYYYADDYATAITYYEQSYNVRKEIGDKRGMSDNLNNIGVLYQSKGNYSKALEYFQKAFTLYEENKDDEGMAGCYNNIGLIMSNLKNFPKAKEYYLKSVERYEKLENNPGIASSLNNLALLYADFSILDSAVTYFFQAVEIYEKENDKFGGSACYQNIAGIYSKLGQTEKELEYTLKSLKLRRDVNDKDGIASSLTSLAVIDETKGNLKEAHKHITEAINLSLQTGNLKTLSVAYRNASGILYKMGKYKEAYNNYKLYSEKNDSLLGHETLKNTTDLQVKYETDKKLKEIELLKIGNKLKQLENEKKETSLNRQRIVIYAFILISLVIAIFAYFLMKTLRQKKRAAFRLQIAYSHIEEKNKHITSSINYAKRIQEAMLKDGSHSNIHLPSHFILFKPKDIVSGDFYWVLEKDDYIYLAVADCTGHGVPGAMLTMLGTSFLNEINAKEVILTPAQILNELREKIIKELSSKGKNREGMDMSLLRLNYKINKAMWAGATNPLWILKSGAAEITEIAADKQPVGYLEKMNDFHDHEFELQKNDQIYLFSDGYADQFGGTDEKKFKYKNLKELLLKINLSNLEDQKNALLEAHTNWKGVHEQTDDICIVSIKI